METTSKSLRREEDNEDKISELPDPIIHLILSHLRTREIVKTTILSRRWKNLWTSMPYLFLANYNNGYFDSTYYPDFAQFVNAVLQFRDASDIHTFRLWWNEHFNDNIQNLLTTWIRYAVTHNVKVLDLSGSVNKCQQDEAVQVFGCMFTCKSLEELKLHLLSLVESNLPEVIRLGRLKKLHLSYMSPNANSLKKLISGCPILEDLELNYCTLNDSDIYSHTLRKLVLTNCQINGEMIRISIPTLQTLFMGNNDIDMDVEVTLENLSSLSDACIQIDNYCSDLHSGFAFGTAPVKFKFISSSDKCIKDNRLSADLGPLTFRNLRSLRLTGKNMGDNFLVAYILLQRSPNLEHLILQKIKPSAPGTGSMDFLHVDYLQLCFHLNFKMMFIFVFGEENEEIIGWLNEYTESMCDCSKDR